MIKNTDRVKYIIVDHKDLFIEHLLRDLIKYDIGYVKIDNEIHFLDKIYRFYDMSEDRKFIINNLITEKALNYEIITRGFNEMYEDITANKYEKLLRPNTKYTIVGSEKEENKTYSEKSYQKQNYKFLKHHNKMINNKLRSSRR